MNLTYLIYAFLIGLLIPFQGIINSRLAHVLNHPYGAALVNFTGGLIIFIIACLVSPNGFPKLKMFANVPPFLYLGGAIGSCFIIGAIFLLPKIGATAWIAVLITAQLCISIILDHYGVLGLKIVKINYSRIIGICLLIAGVYFITATNISKN